MAKGRRRRDSQSLPDDEQGGNTRAARGNTPAARGSARSGTRVARGRGERSDSRQLRDAERHEMHDNIRAARDTNGDVGAARGDTRVTRGRGARGDSQPLAGDAQRGNTRAARDAADGNGDGARGDTRVTRGRGARGDSQSPSEDEMRDDSQEVHDSDSDDALANFRHYNSARRPRRVARRTRLRRVRDDTSDPGTAESELSSSENDWDDSDSGEYVPSEASSEGDSDMDNEDETEARGTDDELGLSLADLLARGATTNIVLDPAPVDLSADEVPVAEQLHTSQDLDGLTAIWDGPRLPFGELRSPVFIDTQPWRREVSKEKTLQALELAYQLAFSISIVRASADNGLPGSLRLLFGVRDGESKGARLQRLGKDKLTQFVRQVVAPALRTAAAAAATSFEGATAPLLVATDDVLLDSAHGTRAPGSSLRHIEQALRDQLQLCELEWVKRRDISTAYIQYGGKASLDQPRLWTTELLEKLRLGEAAVVVLQPAAVFAAPATPDGQPLVLAMRALGKAPQGSRIYPIAGLLDVANMQALGANGSAKLLQSLGVVVNREGDAEQVIGVNLYCPTFSHLYQLEGAAHPMSARRVTAVTVAEACDVRDAREGARTKLGKRLDAHIAHVFDGDRVAALRAHADLVTRVGSPLRLELLISVKPNDAIERQLQEAVNSALQLCRHIVDEASPAREQLPVPPRQNVLALPGALLGRWLSELATNFDDVLKRLLAPLIESDKEYFSLPISVREAVAVVEALMAALVTGDMPYGERRIYVTEMSGKRESFWRYRALVDADVTRMSQGQYSQPEGVRVLCHLRHVLAALPPAMRERELRYAQNAAQYELSAPGNRHSQALVEFSNVVVDAFHDDVAMALGQRWPRLVHVTAEHRAVPRKAGSVKAIRASNSTTLDFYQDTAWASLPNVRDRKRPADVAEAARMLLDGELTAGRLARRLMAILSFPVDAVAAAVEYRLNRRNANVVASVTGAGFVLGTMVVKLVRPERLGAAETPAASGDPCAYAWRQFMAKASAEPPTNVAHLLQRTLSQEARDSQPPLWFAYLYEKMAAHACDASNTAVAGILAAKAAVYTLLAELRAVNKGAAQALSKARGDEVDRKNAPLHPGDCRCPPGTDHKDWRSHLVNAQAIKPQRKTHDTPQQQTVRRNTRNEGWRIEELMTQMAQMHEVELESMSEID